MNVLKKIKSIVSVPYFVPSSHADVVLSHLVREKGVDEIIQKIKGLPEVANVALAPPGFVNISLTEDTYKDLIQTIIDDPSFGSNTSEQGVTWVVEHTSPNPNKAMHIGHLRNNLIGMSIARLLEKSGAKVICDAVDNNRGIAIAKMMYGFLMHMGKTNSPKTIEYWKSHKEEWFSPEEKNLKPDVFVSVCYELGAKDYEDAEAKKIIKKMVVDWEDKDPSVWELWRHVLAYSYEGMQRTLKRIGNRWDVVWHEHEHYEEGKELVLKGLKKGIFTQLEDGAVLTSFTDLPDTILLKNDGTSLYITQDIALTKLKKETYKADKLVWIIGPEQATALKQLFTVCSQLGIGAYDDFVHVSYGYVGLKVDGGFKKMSSREGNAILIDDIIDETKGRLPDGKADKEKIALAAVKFSMLKSERTQQISYDIETSTETHGDSGVYILYTFVRAKSLLKKLGAYTPGYVVSAHELTNMLLFFPEVVLRSKETLSAHHVAQYLLKLCALFNDWYARERIVGASDEKEKTALVMAVSKVIQQGCELLGIELVEEM